MMACRFRFAIVIPDDRTDDVAVAPVESRDISVERQIFTVLVVAAVTDAMTNIMEKRAGLKLHARLWGQMVDGLKLIKEHEA